MTRGAGSAGVVLVGGRSVRMGASKAALEWHGSTLLRRTVGAVARVVDGPVVVVREPGQVLPALPRGTEVVHDPVAGLGPLQGVAAGLTAVAGRAPVAAVCAVDLPLLHPVFLRRMLHELERDPTADAAFPVAHGHAQPLAAAYRTELAPLITALVDGGERRMGVLLEQISARRLDEATLLADAALVAVDPLLDSLRNVNTADEYQATRARPAPEVRVALAGHGERTVRAATLSGAAAAAGVVLDGSVRAAVGDVSGTGNPGAATMDPETPLFRGDAVTFSASPRSERPRARDCRPRT
jgi:molybdenum cofactor guanylyltransferase